MKAGVLAITAWLLAVYLSTVLTVLGIEKFHYLLAGGSKFATFPDLGSQLSIGLSYLALAIVYLVWFFGKPLTLTAFTFPRILKITAPFLLLALLAYPLGNDVYLYLHAGLMNLNGLNPFLVRAGEFTSELSPYVDWGQTSTYGPVSQALFTLSAAAVPVHPLLAVYCFKAICLGFHILNGSIIWKVLSVPERDRIAIAYLVNPLLLMEQVGSAHVDVLISTSLVAMAACLFRKREAGVAPALWFGLLSKTLPLIWMPLTAVVLLRQRRWQSFFLSTLFSVGIAGLLCFTVFPEWVAWKSLLNPGVAGQYQSSLHSLAKFGLDLIRIFQPTLLDLEQQNQILLKLSGYTLIGFTAFYGWMALRILRQRSYSAFDLLNDLGWTTLVLLLFATPWLMPWYASILITFAALIPGSQLFGLTSLAFGLSSSAQYALHGAASLKSLVMLGLPILTLLLGEPILRLRSPNPQPLLIPEPAVADTTAPPVEQSEENSDVVHS